MFFCVMKMPLFLVRIYNQQVQATITLMIFDLQGAFQIPGHLPLKHNFVKQKRAFLTNDYVRKSRFVS